MHDVIGTRCDPYTHNLLSQGGQYHYCCHSNLTRAFARKTGMAPHEAETYVHDVLNVFMCTGFMRDTGQYFMRGEPGETGRLSRILRRDRSSWLHFGLPRRDCSAQHSSDTAKCYPMIVETFKAKGPPEGWAPPPTSGYDGTHGE